MTREEAARVLEHFIEIFNECDKFMWPDGKITALKAIATLRDNPCDNCIGPAMAISYGYKDMRTKKPEVEK